MTTAGGALERVRAGGLRALIGPGAAVGVLGLAVVLVPAGRDVVPVSSRLDLAVLLLAVTTAPALVEPAGPVADATPTGRLVRRSSRLAVSSVVAALALVVVRIAAPSAPGSSSAPGAVAELALHVGLVAAVGGIACRWRPDPIAAASAGSIGVLVGVGPQVAGLDNWSVSSRNAGTAGVLLGALVAAVAFALASRDPASG